ncbi:MAG TPA: FMN-binding negative transcriptional regulator [Gemmataceae bacterium]|nr:FMN-binding negative transcriptional regulator [Gemmataceae bacterium]
MYIPAAFKVEDRSLLYDFIERYSFATLITTAEGIPFASHLPLLLDREREVLLGHLARANPHWQSFDGMHEGLIIFSGPHAYISPSWYATSPAVPTWNYAAVHVYGTPRLLEADQLSGLLARLVSHYEAGNERPWQYDLPEDYRQRMERAVVGVEVPITRIEGKFKLGQNRTVEDRRGMLTRLKVGHADGQALAAFMEAYARP